MKKILLIIVFVEAYILVCAQYNSGIKLEPLLKTDTTSIGQKIQYPTFDNVEVSIYRITIPAGKSTGWHFHTFPVFAYIEKGTLTVEIKNRKKLTFIQGQSFPEVINIQHNGINNGKEDVVLFAVFLGEKGKPLSEHLE
jgi:quercetin dioxygenase-like cupin family protein